MSNVRYIKCDICGDAIPDSDLDFKSYGKRIFYKMLNHIDICGECIAKIQKLSIDSKIEDKCVCECIDNNPYQGQYANGLETAYLEGVQAALDTMSHNRLKKNEKILIGELQNKHIFHFKSGENYASK